MQTPPVNYPLKETLSSPRLGWTGSIWPGYTEGLPQTVDEYAFWSAYGYNGLTINSGRYRVPVDLGEGDVQYGYCSFSAMGADFLGQVTLSQNERGEALSNFYGTDTYQTATLHYDSYQTGIDPNIIHYPAIDGTRQVSYAESSSDRTDPVTHVTTTSWTFGKRDVTGGNFIATEWPKGTTPTNVTYYRLDTDDQGNAIDVPCGSLELSGPVTGGWLAGQVAAWSGISDGHRWPPNNQESGNMLSTESEDGARAVRSAAVVKHDYQSEDITSDTPPPTPVAPPGAPPGYVLPPPDPTQRYYGWHETVQASVTVETRRNMPVVYDLKAGSASVPGVNIYNTYRNTITLTDPITDKKWKDAYGIFSDVDPTAALAALSWTAGWTKLQALGPPTVCNLMIVSATGNEYQVTVQGKNGDGTVIQTATVAVTPDAPGVIENFGGMVPLISQLSMVKDGVTAVLSPPFKYGADLSQSPDLLVSCKARWGALWGFPALNLPTDGSVTQEMRDMRWATRTTRSVGSVASIPQPDPTFT